jgi:hypothetical protein
MKWVRMKFFKHYVGMQFSDDEWPGYTVWESIGSFKLGNYLITYAIYDPDKYEPTPSVLLEVDNGILYIDGDMAVPDIDFLITPYFVISMTRIK